MTNAEKELAAMLRSSNNFEEFFEADSAETPTANAARGSRGVGAELNRGGGQPANYTAQIDVLTLIRYTLVADNSIVAPAALPGAAQTGLPAFYFGNADYFAGFNASYKQTPLNPVWSLVGIYVSGVDDLSSAIYTNIRGLLKKGDLLFRYAYSTTHFGFIVISCNQVGYLTLLTSISSDRFVINQIRYTITDANKVGQFDQNINMIRQTLFGKISSDFISPVSFRNPMNQQTNIIDIPIMKGIDKETILTTYVNFDVGSFTFSIFIKTQNKLVATA